MDAIILIPESVYGEIKNKPLDGNIDEDLQNGRIRKETINEVELERLRNRYPTLGKGELEAIAISRKYEHTNCVVLLDDKSARKVALELGIKYHGLLWLLERCCECKTLKGDDVLRLLDKIDSSTFRVSKELISKVKQRILSMLR